MVVSRADLILATRFSRQAVRGSVGAREESRDTGGVLDGDLRWRRVGGLSSSPVSYTHLDVYKRQS